LNARHIRTALSCLTLICAAPAPAGPARDAVERAQDNAEIRQDRRQHLDDAGDLRHLRSLAERFDAARERGDAGALRLIDRELRSVVAGELGEGRAELAADRAELRRDNREVRASRREVARDVASGAPVSEVAGDRHDLRDDRRDRRDDRRDAAAEQQSQLRRRQIANELGDLAGRLEAPALDRKRALLGELIGLAQTETADNRREIHEDRRERREDRRERAEGGS